MPHALPKCCLASTAAGATLAFEHLDDSGLAQERPAAPQRSPIDHAMRGLVLVTRLAEANRADWEPEHGLMLSASAVAVAEDYFRTILVDAAVLCPVCLDAIGTLETRIEFVRSGSLPDALRATLDRTSLSSRSGVKDWSKTIAGLKISDSSALGRALHEYELVCHVRHCAVHSGGYVGSHNATILDVPPGSWISFSTPDAIHSVVAVVTRTIRSFNQNLFEHLLSRWIQHGTLVGEWATDRELVDPLWRLFCSFTDTESARAAGEHGFHLTSYNAYRSFRAAVIGRAAAVED